MLGFQPDGFYVASADHMLHVGFVGTAGVAPEATGGGDGRGKAPALTRVRYAELWTGIDLDYEAAGAGIARSTWRVQPGADVGRIRLRYNLPVAIEEDGSLRLRHAQGWMRESPPVAWQEIDGERKPVEVAFRLLPAAQEQPEIGFALGAYDPAHALLIDPTLQWNTFMGSTTYDNGSGIAVDESGNVYVAGSSFATWGSPVNPYAGGYDAFAAKLDGRGALVWNTFLGSASRDYGKDIAVDASGNVYVTGSSVAPWGLPVNPYAGDQEAFAAKIATGDRDDVGVYRPGNHRFYLDVDGNSSWTTGDLSSATFGIPGDLPVIGDWNGHGVDEIGVYRPGNKRFYLDLDGSDSWTAGDLTSWPFGIVGDIPVTGDWNGDGFDEIGVYRPGNKRFYLDMDASYDWTTGDLTSHPFGITGDIPVTGKW